MTMYKIRMVTRNTTHLVIVIFSCEVEKMKFLLLCLDRNLFCVVSSNRYLPRGSNETILSVAITVNITISR